MKISRGIPLNSLPEYCRKMNPKLFRQSHPLVSKSGAETILAIAMSLPDKRPAKLKIKWKDGFKNKFEMMWEAYNGPVLIKEFKFCPDRRWRADYYHHPSRIIIELEGGIFCKSMGHSSITGLLRDIEKYNEMEFLGHRLFRLHAGNMTLDYIRRIIGEMKL